jgi:hypothetical protein
MGSAQAIYLLISALGGALGALILRSIVKFIGFLSYRWRPLAIYDCAVQEPTKVGELRHSWGDQKDDEYSTNRKAWEYSPVGTASCRTHILGEHTIYGPYLNDFGKPGFYRVRFRIRGINAPKSNDPVIALDVVKSPFGDDRTLILLGQRIIKANELFGHYQNFDIVCHAPGTGVYEYRCTVFPNMIKIEECKIRFDCIKIYSHPSIWDIF